MNDSFTRPRTVERFRPDPGRLYDVDMTARLAGVPRHSVLVYCRWGFVHPATDPEYDDERVLAGYVLQHYARFMTQIESQAFSASFGGYATPNSRL